VRVRAAVGQINVATSWLVGAVASNPSISGIWRSTRTRSKLSFLKSLLRLDPMTGCEHDVTVLFQQARGQTASA